MYNEIINFYSRTPPNKGILDDYNLEYWEENRTCGDDLKVYIKVESNKIKNWSFTGDTAIITTACASMFGESIIGMELQEVLTFNYEYIKSLMGMPVSDRRKQAAVLGLLTTRNAIHSFLKDGKKDIFDDLID